MIYNIRVTKTLTDNLLRIILKSPDAFALVNVMLIVTSYFTEAQESYTEAITFLWMNVVISLYEAEETFVYRFKREL